MAKYRQIHITYWQDPFVEDLDPLEKYFYLYLMTNSKTTQCGCYEISNKLIKYETGLNQDQIDKFIKLFTDKNKIKYDPNTKEFLITNWLKHNSFKSPKVKSCIIKELKEVKNIIFKEYIESIVGIEKTIDSLSKSIDSLSKSIDTSSQQEQEQEQEQKKEKEQQQEKPMCVDSSSIPLENLLEAYGISPTISTLNRVRKVNPTKERLKEVLDFIKNENKGTGFFIKAIEDNYNLKSKTSDTYVRKEKMLYKNKNWDGVEVV